MQTPEKNNGPRVAVCDIETAPMTVYTWSLYKPVISINQIITPGRILGVGWKWTNEKRVRWLSEFDLGREEMLRQVHALVDEAEILVGWNSESFDEKHLKAEFALAGLPPVSPYQSVDLIKTVRKHFRLASNKLDFVAQHFGIGAKLKHSGFDLWIRCMNGDPKAWKEMAAYCKQDVAVEADVYRFLLPYVTNHPPMGLWTEKDCCPNCASENVQRRGYARTKRGVYQRYQCQDCFGWSTGRRMLAGVEIRGTG